MGRCMIAARGRGDEASLMTCRGQPARMQRAGGSLRRCDKGDLVFELMHDALAFDAQVRVAAFADGKVGAVIAVSNDYRLSLASRLAPYGGEMTFSDPQLAWGAVASELGVQTVNIRVQ